MSLPTIKPDEARRLLDSGALLIDIRETDEHAREKIPGARHLPLSKLDEAELAVHQGNPVIFHCKSGARTTANALRLAGEARWNLRGLHCRRRARRLAQGGAARRDRPAPTD